jgi:hypothetical protein
MLLHFDSNMYIYLNLDIIFTKVQVDSILYGSRV